MRDLQSWSKVAFVIPCFNDAKALRNLIPTLPASSLKIIIDDGSTEVDSISDSSLAGIKSVKILRHFINLGQGAALETGFEHIRRYCPKIEFIFTFDADGQHSISDAEAMLGSMIKQPCEVILGSRFLGRTGYGDFEGGLPKYLMLRFAALISQITLGMKLTDRHNGLRLLNRKALMAIHLVTSGYGHADEILRKIKSSGLSYREFPVTIKYRVERLRPGQSILSSVKIVFDRLWGGQ